MKGDFTRDTFDARRHFSRVLMQQGRVQLDADWNEQSAILLHYLRTLAADLIGPHGGPADYLGFGILGNSSTFPPGDKERLTERGLLPLAPGDFLIGPGRYYVGGLLCESEDYVRYSGQADYALPDQQQPKQLKGTYVVYLDVWERHLSSIEAEDAQGAQVSFREAALGGPDTATRAQVVWQVKARAVAQSRAGSIKDYAAFLAALGDEARPGTGLLKARAIQPAAESDNPCILPPESRYRGPENQLYRVEVHLGGTAGGASGATFKWSRENGALIFPIRQIADRQVALETLGRDGRLGLRPGDWVEIVDDDYTLQNRAEPLLQIESVDPDSSAVTLRSAPSGVTGRDSAKHPLLRRWDQRPSETSAPTGDGIPISEGEQEQRWIELEDGIQVQFQPAPGGRASYYRRGDYWLIPARTASGDVEWPGPPGAPLALGPRGEAHAYAPLWIISAAANQSVTADPSNDQRRTFHL